GYPTYPIRSTSSSTTLSCSVTNWLRPVGRWVSRCSTGSRSGSKRQLAEKLVVSFEPRFEREPPDGALPRGRGVVRTRGENAGHGLGERLRRRRDVARPTVGMRDSDPGLVADELDRASARRIHDRQTAGHRLDHRARTWILDLGVQQEMRPAQELGCFALRIPADELHTTVQSELLDQRSRR